MLASLSAQISRDFEVIVVDLGSTDVDLKRELLKYPMKSRLAIKPLAKGGKINRSAGRNHCVRASRAGESDILFFLDADMLVPNNFCQLVMSNVSPGTCFFPICYSLHEGKPTVVEGNISHHRRNAGQYANGWWRKEGWGNFGILQSDYKQLGAWDENIGKTYGGEDNNIRDRAHKLFTVRRFNCPGFSTSGTHPIDRR